MSIDRHITMMKHRRVKNRLLELIQERERKIGRRLKQHDIAQFAGVSDHAIISWIRNKTSIYDGKTIERLCTYFECEIGDLLYFEEIDVDQIND